MIHPDALIHAISPYWFDPAIAKWKRCLFILAHRSRYSIVDGSELLNIADKISCISFSEGRVAVPWHDWC